MTMRYVNPLTDVNAHGVNARPLMMCLCVDNDDYVMCLLTL